VFFCVFLIFSVLRMQFFDLYQVPPEAGTVADDTGAEEAIVPTDMNLLTGHLLVCSRVQSRVA
jgi:hypothetical protein